MQSEPKHTFTEITLVFQQKNKILHFTTNMYNSLHFYLF